MAQLKVMSLEGTIDSYHPEVPTTGFVKMKGNVNPPESFELRTGVFMPVGTPVDVVALVYVHKDGSYGSSCVFGIKTEDGKVCYDLTRDHPKIMPFMVPEETSLFQEAQRLLYK